MDRKQIEQWGEEAKQFAIAMGCSGHIAAMGTFEQVRDERFAALVAAHEREQCALSVEAVDLYNEYDPAESFAAAIRARGEVTPPR